MLTIWLSSEWKDYITKTNLFKLYPFDIGCMNQDLWIFNVGYLNPKKYKLW